MNKVCIYHGGCPDGFGAAFAVWRSWGDDARYIGRGHYDEPLLASHFADALVTFVDIAPDNDELSSLADAAEQESREIAFSFRDISQRFPIPKSIGQPVTEHPACVASQRCVRQGNMLVGGQPK